MKIFFLIPYPLGEAPSQRFRFEQYLEALTDMGHVTHFQSFLSHSQWRVFFENGETKRKIFGLVNGFTRRIAILFKLPKYDFIFIHREAAPIGPPVFEWIIFKILQKKIIYDFDDAIWLTDRKDEPSFLKAIKWRNKVAQICTWAHKISCGNEYLCLYAKLFNSEVIYNPTTIDTVRLHDPELYSKKKEGRLIIGWTGSHSTLKYLNGLESILKHLEDKYANIEFWVISDRAPKLNLKKMFFKPWSLKTEIAELIQFDIGIMPLLDDEWAKGKCGFKALQYMALQIPTVASPVGVNCKIIRHGENGFLCNNSQDWKKTLELLIENEQLRNSIRHAGRETVVNNYSVLSNSENFLKLFAPGHSQIVKSE